MVGAPGDTDAGTRSFLNSFAAVPLDEAIAEGAVALRRAHWLRPPDAIVWASAIAQGCLLVTRARASRLATRAIPAIGRRGPRLAAQLGDHARALDALAVSIG